MLGAFALAVPGPALADDGDSHGDRELRFATFNASVNRNNDGQLTEDLSTPDDPQLQNVAEIIQRVRPDVRAKALYGLGRVALAVASVAAARGRPLDAATLAGAAEALHDSINAPASRAERAVGERFLAPAGDKAGGRAV